MSLASPTQLRPWADTEIFNLECASFRHSSFIFKYSIGTPVGNHTRCTQWRTQKIFIGVGLVKGHMVVICIWCALFVTSQFDIISIFPNQRFGKVIHIICIFFYIHSPYFKRHCTEYKLSALHIRLSEKN